MHTDPAHSISTNHLIFNRIPFGFRPALSTSVRRVSKEESWNSLNKVDGNQKWKSQEDIMQMAITFMAVVGGMIFSVAVALLAEELIFGQVFRLFLASG